MAPALTGSGSDNPALYAHKGAKLVWFINVGHIYLRDPDAKLLLNDTFTATLWCISWKLLETNKKYSHFKQKNIIFKMTKTVCLSPLVDRGRGKACHRLVIYASTLFTTKLRIAHDYTSVADGAEQDALFSTSGSLQNRVGYNLSSVADPELFVSDLDPVKITKLWS